MPSDSVGDRGEGRSGASRNPAWERDELILALDLYVDAGLVDDTDPRTMALSDLLNQLPLHPLGGDDRFRSPSSVHLKLANFAALDPSHPGAGMTHGGRRDQEVWDEFVNDTARLRLTAQAIRQEANSQATSPLPPVEDEDQADEGRLLFRSHRVRERNPRIVREKKRRVLALTGALACEVCSFEFVRTYRHLGEGYIECHHIVPLAAAGRAQTRLADLAVVCSNCHQMLHRGDPAPTLEQLRALVRDTGT